MKIRMISLAGTLMVVALFVLALVATFAQTAKAPYEPPRMRDGHPDLSGTYDLATMTPLERPAGAKAVLTNEEAAKLEAPALGKDAQLEKAIEELTEELSRRRDAAVERGKDPRIRAMISGREWKEGDGY